MSRSRRLLASLVLCAGVPLAVLACDDRKPSTASPTPPPNRPAAAQAASAASLGDAGTAKVLEFTEADFIESDRNRDPFRSFAKSFNPTQKETTKPQLDVLLPQYAIDELKMVAIVTGDDSPRAMLIDPTSKGWVIKRGDYLGKPDIVHTGGQNGTDYQVYWRVERIRDGDVVLVRVDPAQPTVAPATRVLPLHSEADTSRFQLN